MSLRTLRCLVLLFLALPLAAQVKPKTEDRAVDPKAKVLGVDVSYLANEGFFLQSGRYSVLIDAFLHEPVGIYAALPNELHKQLVNAQAPFDGLTLVFVSHDHPDHVQMRGLEKYLAHNNNAQLMTSPQVIQDLKSAAQDFPSIQRRVTPVLTAPGSPQTLGQAEMSVTFLQIPHGGKGNENIVNLGHLISMGGLKILHVGDAEPNAASFAPYNLKAEKLDIVFVPYWFFGSPGGAQVLNEQIPARVQIACHVPPKEWDKLNTLLKEKFPKVVLFKDPLEKRTFLPEGVQPSENTQGGIPAQPPVEPPKGEQGG